MNVAASNATPLPSTTRVDASQAPAPVDDGLDHAGAADPASQGFSQILSKSMAKDGEQDARTDPRQSTTGDKRDDPTVMATDAATAAATTAAGTSGAKRGVAMLVPPDLYSTITSMRGVAGEDAAKDGGDVAKLRGDASKDDEGDAAGNDLAAQLALVSQWAGIAPPAPAPTTAPDPAATRGDAFDIKGKLDALRGTVAKSSADKAAIATAGAEAVDPTQTQGAVVASAAAAAGRLSDRDARIDPTSPRAAPIDVVGTKPDGVRPDGPRDSARAASVDSLAASMGKLFAGAGATTPVAQTDTKSIDKLFAIAGANAQGGAADASSIANAFVTQVAAQVSNAQASITAAPGPGDMLREPVGTAAWSHEVGQAALRMATSDLQSASLHLNPEHLGPLEVQMRVDNGVAHLQFTATHADTRQALESSRTTLDQMFSDQGIKLGDWSVGHSSSGGTFARDFGAASSQGDGGNRQRSGHASTQGDDVVTATVTTRTPRALGLVDTFA